MNHIYMYNTTFCLNSQSLAVFLGTFFFSLHYIHNSYALDEEVFPQHINLVMWSMCLNLRVCVYLVLNVCVFNMYVCVCVHTRIKEVGQFNDESPFCYAGQLYPKTQLVSW